MRHSFAIFIAIWVGTLAGIAYGARLPKFSDYPTRRTFTDTPAKPQFRAGEVASERYRDSVIFNAEQGPNFAGRYTLATWTCGTGCSQAIVIDSETGKLFRDMPFEMLVLPLFNKGFAPYSYRLNSRLLIVEGYFDLEFPEQNSECSRRYYEWTGTSFKLLRKLLLKCTPAT